jgi:hypothetical protein
MQKAVVIISLIVLFTGCRKDKRIELFEMNYFQDFTIQSGLNTIETHIYEFPFLTSQFKERLLAGGILENEVGSVEAKFATLSTVFNDVDLELIRDISVLVFDPANRSLKLEIFYLDPVPYNTGTRIRPFPALPNVKDIMKNNTFNLEIRLRFRVITPESMDMRFQYDLSAKGI